MIIVVLAGVALVTVSVVLLAVLLADFARASRRDSIFLPPDSSGTRRARRVTGMYTRGSDLDPGPDADDDRLVSH
ncbi:hypothetical protein [Actinomadura parmotrematis]|uniref:Secreted protein n=1 Tax=Actinomadura parmotrematis TaxID=2864039 RepID=A0ABS7FWE7_9ACTN|nr:hypothetical protein [Actinomadura parmotrematis]MBW8484760.1 hypothetical protein [Actinomadura parmotrematis]